MNKIITIYVNSILTKGRPINNTLTNNKVFKNYEITSFSTSYFL